MFELYVTLLSLFKVNYYVIIDIIGIYCRSVAIKLAERWSVTPGRREKASATGQEPGDPAAEGNDGERAFRRFRDGPRGKRGPMAHSNGWEPETAGRHPRNALSTAFVRRVTRPGRYCDGHGLYLDVQPSGTRSWVQRLVIRGRRREMGLGGFPLVSLQEARAEALANRKLARAGGDPRAERRRARNLTFAAAAERVWAQMRPGWRNPKYARDWLSGLARLAFPHIGDTPVDELTSADVIETLRPVWHRHPATARRLRQRIDTVMAWAVAMELRPDNPCGRIGLVLGRQQDLVRHMPALPHNEVAAALAAVRGAEARPAVKLAFEFLVLTAPPRR